MAFFVHDITLYLEIAENGKMNKIRILLAVIMLSFLNSVDSIAQRLMLRNSSLSASSRVIDNSNSFLALQQVVAQTSLVGIAGNSKIQLSQGFLQPFTYAISRGS